MNPYALESFWRYVYGLDESPDPALGTEPMDFVFPVGEGCLVVVVELEAWEVRLELADADGESIGLLGWWDEARWHPYALRMSEADRVVGAVDDQGAPVALALLAPFVGHASDEAVDSHRTRVASALGALGVPNAGKLAQAAVRRPDDDDYAWREDPDLGWVFDGEYPCYSTRNPAHAGTEEAFPFEAFRKLRVY